MDDELDAIEKTQAMTTKRLCPKCRGKKLIGTKFGNSNLIIDWCPSCHGIWLDRDEFLSIVEYLDNEYDHLSPREAAKDAEKEVAKIFTGHENIMTEIVDAEAAIKALMNISIFQHPKLAGFLIQASDKFGRLSWWGI